ncbi:MAG: hypothetical protein QM703_11680 [Gemmatales bacterium]
MRRFVVIFLCLLLLINGCKTQPSGEFPQPNWVDRRLDRLETWNRRHGYPMEKTRDTTKFVVASTVIAVGAVACGLAYLILQSELDKLAEPKVPGHN